MYLSHKMICISLIFMIMSACKPSAPDHPTIDLLGHGIPLKVKAPEDVVIASSDLGILKDVTIKNDQGFSMQIFESEATSLDGADISLKLLSDITASRFFSEIISENDNGFIFEKKIDEDYITYDFRRVFILGDKQYVIQAGMGDQHTLDQVQLMYKSID